MNVLTVIQKPPKGQPCNQCGACCRYSACLLSIQLLNSWQAPCIALESLPDGRFACGLIVHPTKYFRLDWAGEDTAQIDLEVGRIVRETLGNGNCDSEDEVLDEKE